MINRPANKSQLANTTNTLIRRLSAFSLVETAIVISIMALLSVAILGGRNLIAAAEVQKVINELTTFEKGVFVFYMQYQYLPGDFPDTAKVWLEDNIKSTCNKVTEDFVLIKDGMNAAYIAGDGDGYVAVAWGNKSEYPAESDIASCHLALSGYLPMNKLGRGIPEYNRNNLTPPLSGNLDNDLPLIPGYWIDNKNFLHIRSQIYNRTIKSVDSHTVPKGNSIMLLGKHNIGGYKTTAIPFSTHISSYVLSSLDKKIDDGKPGTGRITFGNIHSHTASAGLGVGARLSTLICTALGSSGIGSQCSSDSKFTNISYSNKEPGHLIYQPKWLHDLTEY